MLAQYQFDVRDILRDANANFYTNTQINRYINRARHHVAVESQCIQILLAGGSPYGSDATVGNSTVGSIVPGAIGNPIGTSVLNTIVGQEKYPFSFFNPLLQQQNNGVKGMVDVASVSVTWGSMRPTLQWMAFEELQAYCRSWNVNMTTYPCAYSVNRPGEYGELWLYPIPGISCEMELLCSCIPNDLTTDSDPDAIPDPYRLAVKYYAAKLAFENTQRWQSAQVMDMEYQKNMALATSAVDRGRVPSFYDVD